jgi:hypothetical protein
VNGTKTINSQCQWKDAEGPYKKVGRKSLEPFQPSRVTFRKLDFFSDKVVAGGRFTLLPDELTEPVQKRE